MAVLAAALAIVPAKAMAQCTLTFNARAQEWTLKDCERKTDVDVHGTPTLFVSASTPVTVIVQDVNPLLYAASIGTITIEKIEVLESLQSIALAAGPVFVDILSTTGLRTWHVDRLTRRAEARQSAATPLETAIANLKDALSIFLGEEAALIAETQRLEFHPTVTVTAPEKTLAAWSALFATLRKELGDAERQANPLQADQRKEASALLDKSGAILKAVATAKLMIRRACLSSTPAGSQDCSTEPASGAKFTVGRTLRPWTGTRATSWDEIATYPLTIARQSHYASNVVTDLPEKLETKFRLASRKGSLLGASLGLTNADVEDPTFGAVADPASPDRKLVTRTGRSQRSGVVSLLGTYAFTHRTEAWALRPMAEFGTTVDTDRPAVFGGGAVGLGRYVRLGFGVTRQRVKALDGQTEGVTVVADEKAIKTHDVWKNGRYWSLTVSISSLPFFSKEK